MVAAEGAAAAAAELPAIEPEIEASVLANGIRLVTERMPEARSATIGFWVGVGGRDEPEPISGASHFLEHLVFKGTETRSARGIAEAIDALGGEMNAFTSREHTAYYTRLPAAALEVGLDLLTDVLAQPALRPHEVDAELRKEFGDLGPAGEQAPSGGRSGSGGDRGRGGRSGGGGRGRGGRGR